MSYFILFLSAFGAATILPFYSEATLIIYLERGYSPTALCAVATLGNTLGATINWAIGRFATKYETSRWYPLKNSNLKQAQAWFQKYGVWSLLFSWLPIGGDALTLIAGTMKVRFLVFLPLTAFGKGARYALMALVFTGLV